MLGSMPRMSTTSRSESAGEATEKRVVGQSMRRLSSLVWTTSSAG